MYEYDIDLVGLRDARLLLAPVIDELRVNVICSAESVVDRESLANS